MSLLTRLFVCDNHPVVLRGFLSLFRNSKCVEIVGTCSWDSSTYNRVLKVRPEVFFCDFLQLCEARHGPLGLTRTLPKVSILAFVEDNDLQAACRALEVGAVGILSKSSPLEAMETAIRRVAEGDNHLDEKLMQNFSYVSGVWPPEQQLRTTPD